MSVGSRGRKPKIVETLAQRIAGYGFAGLADDVRQLGDERDEAIRQRDQLRAELDTLFAVLATIRDMDWPPGHAITAANDMRVIARQAMLGTDRLLLGRDRAPAPPEGPAT